MTEKRPIDANELMARFFRKECLMRGHNAAASAAYKDAQKTVTAAPTVSLRPEWRNPETDPPKVEEDVMILFETACGGCRYRNVDVGGPTGYGHGGHPAYPERFNPDRAAYHP